ncbi:tyrosine-type recombinase/integrase, partial [Vibrio kanaloae]
SQPRNAFTRIKERAGIKNPKEVCFHVARHSFATNLIENNVDVLTVQRLMNHKD